MTIDVVLFHVGVVVFAITGVLAAARQNMDVMSFVIIGVVTAVGGGTLRDLMLDQPLFWLEESSYLYTATLASVATFFFEQRFRATLRAPCPPPLLPQPLPRPNPNASCRSTCCVGSTCSGFSAPTRSSPRSTA